MSDTKTPEKIETALLIRTFRNHTITFDPHDMKFHVSGPEFEQYKDTYCTFSSFAEAQAKITAEVSEAEKLALQNIVFEQRVVDENGQIHTITRIDRRSGDVAGIDTRYLFPNVMWLRLSIQKANALKREYNALENTIFQYRISKSRYHARIDAEDYPRRIKSLADEITKKTELAQANDPANSSNVTVLKTE